MMAPIPLREVLRLRPTATGRLEFLSRVRQRLPAVPEAFQSLNHLCDLVLEHELLREVATNDGVQRLTLRPGAPMSVTGSPALAVSEATVGGFRARSNR